MPQKPKAKSSPEKQEDALEEASVVEDQNSRGYYYDDAHGYEIYKPDEDHDDDVERGLEPCHE